MMHKIMNLIAPITSLSETMVTMIKDKESDINYLRINSLDAFESIHDTASGLLVFPKNNSYSTRHLTHIAIFFAFFLVYSKIVFIFASK
jgi:hypothetical protein